MKAAAGPRLAELDAKIAELGKQAAGNARPEFGYHSALSAAQDAAKWVQVDLGRSVVFDRVLVQPAFDDVQWDRRGIRLSGAVQSGGVGRCGVSRRTRLPSRSKRARMRAIPARRCKPSPRRARPRRYVRITATKLAPRKGDFIFALAELKVLDIAGHNLAAGAAVTALDSIEAPPRWRKTNLVDEVAPPPMSGLSWLR